MANIKIDGIEIMEGDLPGKMAWSSVNDEIQSLGGNGWRLPTESEFSTIYRLYKLGIGGFKKTKYWSSSSYLNDAWYFDLSVGYSPHVTSKTNLFYVRLVRSL
jgi:hypothetical protein